MLKLSNKETHPKPAHTDRHTVNINDITINSVDVDNAHVNFSSSTSTLSEMSRLITYV